MRLTLLLAMTASVFAQSSASNGVYGGYVGSSRWFDLMRQSAANASLLQSLGGRHTGPVAVPPDYVEVSGEFTFVRGNPFPGGRLPDLRILCADPSADAVPRAPFVATSGNAGPSFYTVLKKGQRYEFYWMYYFGGKEQLGRLDMPQEAPGQLRLTLLIDPKGHGQITAVLPKSYK